ncbi:MAG: DNA polymerase I [Clostridiales bacterium]|nr:DNA polymerase I [Clostridiales bacterium]
MKLLIIDGNSIMNRSFYGVRPLTTKSGINTNAIFGFLNIMLKTMKEVSPDGVAVAFDLPAPTFRHKMYDGYKGTRKPSPDELREQFPYIKALLRALGHTVIECEGYEADDIIGTLAKVCQANGDTAVISTGDRDSLQLTDKNITVHLVKTKDNIDYTPEKIKEEYGLEPDQLRDVKALMGDSSDNIPGVKGIGEKTALHYIQTFGSIENLYDNLDSGEIKPRARELLIQEKETCFLSKQLGTIDCAVPLDFSLPALYHTDSDKTEAAKILSELEMYSFLPRLGLENLPAEKTAQPDKPKTELKLEKNQPLDALKIKLTQYGKIDFLLRMEKGRVSSLQFHLGDTISVYDFNAENIFFEVVCQSELPKRTFDVKPVYLFCEQHGVTLSNVSFDAVIAAYLLHSGTKSYHIGTLAQHFLPEEPLFEQEEYRDIALLAPLCDRLYAALEKEGMLPLFQDIEMPLTEVLASMEYCGFAVDAAGIRQFGEQLQAQIELLRQQMFDIAGYEFNPNSTNDLSEILFNKLGLPAKKKTKSGYSTNAEVLESLKNYHPFVQILLEYRKLSKLNSTYVVGLLKVIDPDGRVRSTFNQTETRTGRISSTEPNMQNIPIRTELGSQMRKFFIAKDGYTLLDADYSQIELRILAHISQDKNMIEAFRNGADIHTITASQIFGIPQDILPASVRSRAKAINFGIVYGISAFSLSQDIGVSVKEAGEYIKNYLTTYSGVDRFMKHAVEEAKETGYAKTIYGRKREIAELKASNHNLRSFGERVAMNAPIQGSAADIIKIAMNRVYRRVKEEKIDGRLILQVHDELLIEVSHQDAPRAKNILKEEMEHAATLSVPLVVDIAEGKNWYDAKD